MSGPRRDSVSLRQLVPTMVTILGLCAGLTSIRFTMEGNYDLATKLILFAAAIDGLDGLLARRLQASSEFGAELDTLSDFLNFGAAPGLLVFQFALGTAEAAGWVFVLVYVVCVCLRLARFNVNRDTPPAGKPHFVGVPAPGGAVLALVPAFLSFQGLFASPLHPLVYAIYLGIVGLLMISRIPTLSSKSIRISRAQAVPVLIGAAIVVGLVVTQFWLLMALAGLTYAAVIVFAAIVHVRNRSA